MVEPISNFEGNAGTFRGGKNMGAKEAKLGRPPQPGERYPSGQLKPPGKRDQGAPPAQLKRLFEQGLRGSADPLFGTALGLMHLEGKITTREHAAGLAYGKLRGRFDRLTGAPSRSTASPDYGTARSAGSTEAMTDKQTAALKQKHSAMLATIHESLMGAWWERDGRGGIRWISPDGQRARCRTEADRTFALLDRVCVEDQPCDWADVERLRDTLRNLAVWFRIGH